MRKSRKRLLFDVRVCVVYNCIESRACVFGMFWCSPDACVRASSCVYIRSARAVVLVLNGVRALWPTCVYFLGIKRNSKLFYVVWFWKNDAWVPCDWYLTTSCAWKVSYWIGYYECCATDYTCNYRVHDCLFKSRMELHPQYLMLWTGCFDVWLMLLLYSCCLKKFSCIWKRWANFIRRKKQTNKHKESFNTKKSLSIGSASCRFQSLLSILTNLFIFTNLCSFWCLSEQLVKIRI